MGAAAMTTMEIFALGFIIGAVVSAIIMLGLLAMTND
jgi:hypothetical protein